MITLHFDFSEYGLLVQSLLSRRDYCKNMIRGESKNTSFYRLYTQEIKLIDSLLAKFEDGSLCKD